MATKRHELQKASKHDYSVAFKQSGSWRPRDEAHPMFSYDRVSSIFWSAFMNGLLDAGFTEQQAVDYMQSKHTRWMLDGDMGDELMLLAYRAGAKCLTTPST